MVTIRTYLNPARAALDKSLLDDHGIPCCVADENAHLYGGGPFAMPIRLLVDEVEAAKATRILESGIQQSAEEPGANESVSVEKQQLAIARNNPWELLVIATLFLVPGIFALQLRHPAIVASKRAYSAWVAVSVFHLFGWLAVVVAISLTILYFYTRAAIRRDKQAAH
jgi:hypothetical protein